MQLEAFLGELSGTLAKSVFKAGIEYQKKISQC